MAALTKKRKGEIAARLRVASSWVGGARSVELLALSKEIDGLDAEEAQEKAAEEISTLPAALRAEAKQTADTPAGQDGQKPAAGK